MELAVERSRDSGWTTILSWLYETGSQYGASSGRPVLWLLLLFALSLGVVGSTNGAVPAQDPRDYRGWEKVLLDKPFDGANYDAKFYRALVISGNAALPPLRLFRTGSLVVPRNGWIAGWVLNSRAETSIT